MDAKQAAYQWLKRAMLVLGAGILSTGCATRALWDNQTLDNFHEPARPNRLAIYQVPEKQDYLVQYDDLSPAKDAVVRRAYYLNENHAATQRASKPRFVDPSQGSPRTPLPVIESTNLMNNLDAKSPVYVVRENNLRFGLYQRENKLIGEYDLPIYPTSAGTVKRALLAPFAVALDVTVVGGMAFVYALAHGGCNFSH
jgi:hypothetical protein